MLFFGEEFGASTPFLYFADWQGELREAVRAGRKREFGHAGAELPDPCDERTFQASRPDIGHQDTADGQRWLELVQNALAVRKTHISPRQHLLMTGQHTAQRIAETGIRACWRYGDGQAIMLELNLGPQALKHAEGDTKLPDRQELYRHAWPDGTPADVWPAWAARWTRGACTT